MKGKKENWHVRISFSLLFRAGVTFLSDGVPYGFVPFVPSQTVFSCTCDSRKNKLESKAGQRVADGTLLLGAAVPERLIETPAQEQGIPQDSLLIVSRKKNDQ